VSSDIVCASCGRSVDAHNQHYRFTLPDPVLDTPEREHAEGTWMSDADANRSVLLQVPNVGPFVRALLPVKLTGGFALTFGVWLAVHPEDLQRAARVWHQPEYSDLVLDGWLANALPVWGLLACPVRAVVRVMEHTPYCSESANAKMNSVLTDELPHDLILSAVTTR